MKVILKKEVKTLGKSGAVVEVSEGYANNFLFPRQLAVPATEGAVKDQKAKEKADAAKEAKLEAEAREHAAALGAKPVIVSGKAGAEGKLYGTVTNKEIAQALKEQAGLEIDRRKIQLDEPIKAIGVYQVEFKLHPKITAKVQVQVKPIE